MNRKFLRSAIDQIYRARVVLTSRELKSISAYSMGGLRHLENLNALAMDTIYRGVAGDFVECGVLNGGSAAAVACAFRMTDRRLWLYDSFAGLPPPGVNDGPDAGDFAGECVGDEASVHAAMRLAQFPPDRYIIKKGWFHETFTDEPVPGPIAMLHIDADWYNSVLLALETFYDRVTEGGLIVLDDFGHWEGCREAFYDFTEERKMKPLMERFGHSQAWWVKGRKHNRT